MLIGEIPLAVAVAAYATLHLLRTVVLPNDGSVRDALIHGVVGLSELTVLAGMVSVKVLELAGELAEILLRTVYRLRMIWRTGSADPAQLPDQEV